ncbi:polysaccharide biosynthesis protein [Phycicoccus sp. BSK3Z-2]|uniref:Polysaccharide biosynthesis protein n=1 Tax=Phycicoccus avicenniae TaxID=2828860 RepID=A0A941DB08_9MICO|nr:oligosaccharide flippase family protein [Phycicoccus avicenniae]MBR7743687.1 polysaccharide biosynthesis protein [Phycicoccus avicenniae]
MTDGRDQLLRGIARGGAFGLLGAVVSAAATFLTVLIVTRSTTQSLAGEFFSATSLFVIAMALCTLGADAGLGRFTARHLVDGNPGAARRSWTGAYQVTGTTSIVVATAALVWHDPLAAAIGLRSDASRSLLVVLAVALPVATLMTVSLAATRSLATMRASVLVDKIGRATLQCLLALLVLVTGGGLVELGLAWAMPYVLAGVVAAFLARSAARRRFGHGPLPVLRGVRRQFWAFTWPRSVAQVSQMTIQRADIIIIGALLTPAAAAVYTAATRFVAFGQFGSQAIQQTLQPRFAHLLASGETGLLREIYKTGAAWSILVSWPIYLAVGAAPGIYLGLFGDGYRAEGTVVVVTMAIAMMVGVASGPVDTMLLMGGRSSLSLVNSLTALVVDLGLCFLLIPRMGILGAAVAWNAAVVVRSGLGFVQVRRLNGLTPLSRSTLVAALASVGVFGLPIAVLSLTGRLSLGVYLVALPVLALVYLTVLWNRRDTLHIAPLFDRLAVGRARTAVDS